MPSLTVENYLKAILQEGTRSGSDWVSTGKLATALNVSPGSVTSMLKTLAESELANYKPYEGVQLTEAGRKLAVRMLRRHRLIELFLVETLGLTWDQVHEEAENMEHAVSDFLIDHIDEFLGRPESDPHGDPIPSANGELRLDTTTAQPLSQMAVGSEVRIIRVTNQDPEFLCFLSDSGVVPGTSATIVENNKAAGLMTLQFDDRTIPLGDAATEQLLVELVGD